MKNRRTYYMAVFIALLIANAAVAEDDHDDHRDGLPEPTRFVAEWLLKPVVPTGFEEVHRVEAKITDPKSSDIFILMTDSKTDQIVWLKRRGKYWNMTVIESIPTQKNY